MIGSFDDTPEDDEYFQDAILDEEFSDEELRGEEDLYDPEDEDEYAADFDPDD